MNNITPPLSTAELSKLLGVAVLCCLLSWVTHSLLPDFGPSGCFFLASGLMMAVLLIGGKRYFWAVWLGGFLANLLVGHGLWMGAFTAFGSAIGTLVAAHGIMRDGSFDARLLSVRDLLKICIWAVLAGSAVCAILGTTTLLLAGVVSGDKVFDTLQDWWMISSLSIILITPLVMKCWPTASNPYKQPTAKNVAESLLIFGLTALFGSVVFLDYLWASLSHHMHDTMRAYLMFVFVIWGGLRLGLKGVDFVILIIAMLAAAGANQGVGFFAEDQGFIHFFSYWLYVFIISLTGTLLSVFLEDKKNAIRLLANSEASRTFEKTLQAQRDFYERISETLGEGLYVQDAAGLCVYLNTEGEHLLGWSREEFIGKPVHDTIHTVTAAGDSLPFNECPIDKANRSGQRINSRDQVFAHRNGSVFPVSVVSQGIFEDGEYSGAVVAFQDITTSKLHEKELSLHREHLEELVLQKTADLVHSTELARAALVELEHQKFVLDQHSIVTITDLEGNIVYGNDKFSKITGFSRDEFMGKNHRIFQSGLHPAEFYKNMYEVLERGEVWQAEVCNKARDGRLYWLDTTIAPFFGSGGKAQRYIAVCNDITKRKAAEVASNVANQAKSEFLANMSHEIRTPMNGVVGMLDILQQTPLSTAQHRMISTIHDSSLILLQIINDILDFSKIEAGKLSIENVPTHLRGVSEEVTKLMTSAANKNSIQLFVFVSPKLPRWVMSDPTRLRQILYNLLGNALKFTNSKNGCQGRVILHVDSCRMADGRPGVTLRVTDNGVGMSEETLNKLFQPFTQADGSIARKFGGTGLGLSIAHRLVSLMDGQISVRSTVGEGTEFTVTLPLQKAPPLHMPVFETSLHGVHVLCVSSDAMVIQIVSAYCSAAGAQVTLVTDLAAARQQPPLSLPLSSMSLVVVLDSDANRELDLPVNIGIVRLAQANENPADNEISIDAYALFYTDLIRSVSLASAKLVLQDSHDQALNQRLGKKVIAPTVEQSLAGNHLILLAEDNETNREVMLEQLHILGYAAEIAEDGAEALKMWQNGRYALLLTDCHMPNMDGFELTAAIRRAEPEGTRMPIIAVTANAMRGEAQNCLAHGMDDYLPKPLRLAELASMLDKWLPKETLENVRHEEAETATGLTPQTEFATGATEVKMNKVESWNNKIEESPFDHCTVWDVTTLPRLMDDNTAMIRRLLDKFLLNTQAQVAAIISAAATGEVGILSDAAHKLKSGARTVGAMQLGELCHEIEDAGRAGDEKTCRALVARLNGVFAAVEEAIKENRA